MVEGTIPNKHAGMSPQPNSNQTLPLLHAPVPMVSDEREDALEAVSSRNALQI